jgi:hypothetical protein
MVPFVLTTRDRGVVRHFPALVIASVDFRTAVRQQEEAWWT